MGFGVRTRIGVLKNGDKVEVKLSPGLEEVCDKVDCLVETAHTKAVTAGWWTQLPKLGDEISGNLPEQDLRYNYPVGERAGGSKSVGDLISLIHTEVSEAYEGHRCNAQDEKLPEFLALEVELADAVIRIFDMAGGLSLRLADALAFKMAYNEIRPDHTHAERMKDDGKKT